MFSLKQKTSCIYKSVREMQSNPVSKTNKSLHFIWYEIQQFILHGTRDDVKYFSYN